jgi:hypothetical protein
LTHGHAHEEAEHASHHAADPFDKRVAMSMVVIAALLAAVKVVGHRTHNETLQYQIKAGVAQSQANVEHTLESDQWNFFQAKKQRQYLYETQAAMMEANGPGPGAAPSGEVTAKGVPGGERYAKEMMKDKLSEADARKILKSMDKVYVGLLKKGFPESKAKQIVDWRIKAAGYKIETAQIMKEAREHNAAGKQHAENGAQYQEKSEHKHHQADYFDFGELGVELALVLSSVAILSKRPGFWYGGIAVGLVGLAIVLMGFFPHH